MTIYIWIYKDVGTYHIVWYLILTHPWSSDLLKDKIKLTDKPFVLLKLLCGILMAVLSCKSCLLRFYLNIKSFFSYSIVILKLQIFISSVKGWESIKFTKSWIILSTKLSLWHLLKSINSNFTLTVHSLKLNHAKTHFLSHHNACNINRFAKFQTRYLWSSG